MIADNKGFEGGAPAWNGEVWKEIESLVDAAVAGDISSRAKAISLINEWEANIAASQDLDSGEVTMEATTDDSSPLWVLNKLRERLNAPQSKE